MAALECPPSEKADDQIEKHPSATNAATTSRSWGLCICCCLIQDCCSRLVERAATPPVLPLVGQHRMSVGATDSDPNPDSKLTHSNRAPRPNSVYDGTLLLHGNFYKDTRLVSNNTSPGGRGRLQPEIPVLGCTVGPGLSADVMPASRLSLPGVLICVGRLNPSMCGESLG